MRLVLWHSVKHFDRVGSQTEEPHPKHLKGGISAEFVPLHVCSGDEDVVVRCHTRSHGLNVPLPDWSVC